MSAWLSFSEHFIKKGEFLGHISIQYFWDLVLILADITTTYREEYSKNSKNCYSQRDIAGFVYRFREAEVAKFAKGIPVKPRISSGVSQFSSQSFCRFQCFFDVFFLKICPPSV